MTKTPISYLLLASQAPITFVFPLYISFKALFVSSVLYRFQMIQLRQSGPLKGYFLFSRVFNIPWHWKINGQISQILVDNILLWLRTFFFIKNKIICIKIQVSERLKRLFFTLFKFCFQVLRVSYSCCHCCFPNVRCVLWLKIKKKVLVNSLTAE